MTRATAGLEAAAHYPIPADEALPQLDLILDEERIRPLAAEALGQAVTRVTVAYVRYKPATSCLVLYRAELEDGSEAQAYARATALDGEYERSPGAALSLPDLRLEIISVRGDRRIRGLRALTASGELSSMLERLVRGSRHSLYAPGWGHWDIVRYKPERRAVLSGTKTSGGRYFIRLYAGRDGERTGALVRALRDSVVCVSAIGRRMRYSQSFRALLTDEVPGTPLSSLPLSAAEAVASSARSLRELHRCPARSVGGVIASPVASAALAVAGIQAILPDEHRQAQALAHEIVGRLSEAPVPACLIHGDFDASQAIVEEGVGAHLIDFDNARPGSPMEDVSSLIARLMGRADADQTNAAARAAAVFVEAYEQAQGWRMPQEQLSAWTALSLLQMTVEPFRRFQPEWPDDCRRILTLAEHALQGGIL